MKLSDHYKIYYKSLLDTVANANWGSKWCQTISGFLLCWWLQCIIDIEEHYGGMFEIEYRSDESKITVHGWTIYQDYILDVHLWIMYVNFVSVVTDNEHLGQIISNEHKYNKMKIRTYKKKGNLYLVFLALYLLIAVTYKTYIYQSSLKNWTLYISSM